MNEETKRSGAIASIGGHDPRFSTALDWIRTIVGALMVAALGAVANNLYQVNLTLVGINATQRQQGEDIAENKQHLSRHDMEIGDLKRDVYLIENKVGPVIPNNRGYRGGPARGN